MSLAAYVTATPRPARRATTYLGLDIGRVADVTCAILLEAKEGLLWVRLIYEMKDTEYHIQLAAINEVIGKYRPSRVVVDATGIGSMLAEELGRKWGQSVVEPFVFSERSKEDLVGNGLAIITDGRLRVPRRFRRILEELSVIRKEITPAGNLVFRDDPHGDQSWAALLAMWATKTSFTPGAVPVAIIPGSPGLAGPRLAGKSLAFDDTMAMLDERSRALGGPGYAGRIESDRCMAYIGPGKLCKLKWAHEGEHQGDPRKG